MLLLKLLNVSLLFGVTNLFISEISGDDTDLIIKADLITKIEVTPQHYDVKLTLNSRSQTEGRNFFYEGECHIDVFIHFPTNYITLHAQKSYIKVYSVVMFSLMGYENLVSRFMYIDGNNKIGIYFTEKLHGSFTLELYFNGENGYEDVFKTFYKNEAKYMLLVATHLRPTRTRALFPCWDDPRLKATFNITIILENKYTALSNMKIQNDSSRNLPKEDTKILRFFQTPKISTYNMLEHTKFAQWIAYNVTQHLDTKYASMLEFDSAGMVVIPGFPHNAMKKLGLNIFREESILYNVSMDPFATQIEVARLVARVVAHERLSNMVSPFWWSDLWINEGIAMLLGQDAINKTFPNLRIWDLFVVQFHQESLRLDTNDVIGPIMPRVTNDTNIITFFSFSYYIKAPVILHTLKSIVTDKIFWDGIKVYLSYISTASLDDFCTSLQIAIANSTLSDPRHLPLTQLDIKNLMHVWSEQTNYPVVNVTRINPSSVRIQIDNINTAGEMYLPITITTQSNLNFTFTMNWQLKGKWLKKEFGQQGPSDWIQYFMNITENDWVIVNLQQTGYYRVKYEVENWQKIVSYLNSDNYTNIHVLNRAQIIDDLFYFWITSKINLDIFLDLIKYLSQEIDYVAWYPVFKNLEYISCFFLYEESTYIKKKFQILLNDFILTLPYGQNSGNIIKCLEEEVAKWACILESTNCRSMATTYLQHTYLEPTYEIHVLPWWKNWAHCKGLMKSDVKTWRHMFDIFFNDTDNEMLEFLTCSENSDVIIFYMNLLLNNEIQNRVRNKGKNVFINIFHSIIARHTKTTLVLEYILENFDHVIPSEIGSMVAITDIINHAYSIRHLNKITEFVFQHKFPNVPFVTQKVQIRLNEIEQQKNRFKYLESR